MQNLTPILLNDTQHTQLKQQLAHILEKEYHITNQSSGKLEYMAAVLMGFTNHQQRRASLEQQNKEISSWPELSPVLRINTNEPSNIITPTTWFGHRLTEDDTCLSKSAMDALISRGWYEFNNDGQYQDFEIEFTYQAQTKTEERKSFNLQMSLDFEDKSIRICLGDNLGDGFNKKLWFTLQGDKPFPNMSLLYLDVLNRTYGQKGEPVTLFADTLTEYDLFSIAFRNHKTSVDFIDEVVWLVNWLQQE